MNLSPHAAAGRSRSVDAGVYLRQNVVHTTDTEAPASPHAWKRVLQERIWSPHGPKGMAARSVLTLLVWHADANGRTWLGTQTIASKAGAGSLRTIRSALDGLVRDGWLQSTPQTWATLTAEQAAAGRPVPRRGDIGQAPNLYVVLDGRGNAMTSDAQIANTTPPRLGLARVSTLNFGAGNSTEGPGQNCQGGPGQNDQGGPPADLHVDLDPKGSRSKIERAERAPHVGPTTHHSSKIGEQGQGWLDAWNVLVAAHAEKTSSVYGLPPLPPDLKRDQQQALAECLDGATADVRAKLRSRTGVERDGADVRRELAASVMRLYFKRDVEHLRRVKHALRDLPREFHARLTEAMQALLRESHDAMPPRRVELEQPQPHADKPVEVVTPEPLEVAPPLPTAQVSTAREARRILEVLNAAPALEERLKAESPPSVNPTKRALPDGFVAELERSSARLDKPVRDKPPADKPTPSVHSMDRAGAPRWGAVGPRPAKVRSVARLQPDEPDVGETDGGGPGTGAPSE